MRVNLKTGLLLLALVCSNANSQQTDLHLLLANLRSPDENVRATAYEKIAADKEALKRPEVQAALFDLLDRENHVLEKPVKDTQSYDESYGEYVSYLADTAKSIVDWHNQRQVCILAQSPYEPNSQFASDLVTKGGGIVIPCLLRMSGGTFLDRYQAIPVLVHVGAAMGDISPTIRQQIRDATISGLTDSNVVIRQGTIEAIGEYGTDDMIPALQKITGTDPVSRRLDNGQLYFTVRESATKAIQSIQERAAKKAKQP